MHNSNSSSESDLECAVTNDAISVSKPNFQACCVHQRIAELAVSRPSAIAVSDGAGTMTYAELDHQAHRLATYLLQLGAGPGVFVALCMNRSPQAIVAMLAVLKTGAAYVPLDPAYPAARIGAILDDVKPVCVCVEKALIGLIPTGMATLSPDLLPIVADANQTALTEISVQISDAAYAIFTSGSSGRPKGVVVEHTNLLNLIDWYIDFYELSPCDRLPYLAGQGFDASVFEIWPTLAAGASLHLPPEEARLSAESLQQWLLQQGITVAFVPTLLAETLVELEWSSDVPLRVLNTAGEALRRYPSKALPFAYYNLYGPTECTVAASVYQMPRSPGTQGLPPIGQPIARTRIHLLDETLCPVPEGSAGEICISGPSVARGYLGRPELTAERFVSNPYAPNRLYRTGDLARQLPDGNLEFLGRNDQQVKLRGNRIELGEIEAILLGHPALADVLVNLCEWDGERRLAAYVVPRSVDAPSARQLRAYLDRQLPAYMVPSAFIVLSRIPLNIHGKRDTAALPAPSGLIISDVPWSAPHSGNEQILAILWQEVLNIPAVGRDDDFFALGGHSLLAMQVIVRLRQRHFLELSIRALFDHRTLAVMAAQVVPAVSLEIGVTPRVASDGPVLLSSMQRGLWFLEQLNPGSSSYNVPMALQINGPLDEGALQRSLRHMVDRHDALRSCFFEGAEGPVQELGDGAALDFEREDFDIGFVPSMDQAVLERMQKEAARPFNLDRMSLFRVRLYRIDAQRHRLLLVFHHLIIDGWSLATFGKELCALYEAHRNGSVLPAPVTRVGYHDFSRWEQTQKHAPWRAQQAAYWAEQLKDVPALELPFDFPRTDRPGYLGGVEHFSLGRENVVGLAAFGEAEQTTLYTLLLVAFQILLQRHTGQVDFAVGSPVANRQCSEFDATIGVFINTLALRADMHGDPSVLECLHRTRSTLLDGLANQNLPFDEVVGIVAPQREPGRNPLFQAMMVLQPAPSTQFALRGVEIRDEFVHNGSSRFDLLLTFHQFGEDVEAVLEYDRALFACSSMQRMAEQLPCLVAAMLRNPQCPISRLEFLPQVQRALLLEQWNGQARAYDLGSTLAHWLQRQAAATPQAEALVFEGERLTYAQIDANATTLALRLRQLDVGRGSFVGVFMERSPELVVALVGILKAGAAYVPLDPGYPAERVAFVAKDAAFTVLLTQEALLTRLPPSRAVIEVLDRTSFSATSSSETFDCPAGPDDPAYMIYTSGSTGQPKGVVISHRGICNRLFWMQEYFQLQPCDRVLQKTPCSFDVSVWEFFWPLMTGATLIVARPDGHRDSRYLAGVIRDEAITTIHFVPSMLRAFLSEDGIEQLPSLSRVICSGEALPVAVVQRFQQRMKAQLHNLYGPTEASVDVSYWSCPQDWQGTTVPIGRPVTNTQLYVLDTHGQLMPPGTAGELYIGGVQLAAGYHDRAALTAEKFVPNPFDPISATRLYRTGDLVRHAADGNILFLGRLDHQVKIRGQRIELGEIEVRLLQHPAVSEAAVLAVEGTKGENRLIAYVVPAFDGKQIMSDVLRRSLAALLPGYMVPDEFVVLPRMPLSPNGKVDRKALPSSDRVMGRAERAPIAPRTPEEQIMALIWCNVLSLSAVSIDDSFFDLGGDSIRVLEVRNLAESRGIPFALDLIFRHPTIRTLVAALLRSTSTAEGTFDSQPFYGVDAAAIARWAPDAEDAFPASHLQTAMLFHSSMEREVPVYHDVFRYLINGTFDATRFDQVLCELVHRHPALRSDFTETQEGRYVQVVHARCAVPLTMDDLRGRNPAVVAQATRDWIENEKRSPFDLSRAPLLRLHVQILSGETFALGLGFHHAILDGWSVATFVTELLEGLAGVPDMPLAPPAHGLGTYSMQERMALESTPSRDFWTTNLADFDRPLVSLLDPHAGIEEAEHFDVAVPDAIVERLRAVAKEAGVPLKTTLLAAHLVLMRSLFGSADVVSGLVSNGRPEMAGSERLLGLFLNVLPFRQRITDRSWLHFMQDVFAHECELVEHRRYPLARIQRDIGATSLIEVVFNFVHFHVMDRLSAYKAIGFDGFEMTEFPLAVNTYFDPTGQRLRVRCVYQKQAFNPDSIERLAARYLQLLEQLASSPGASITAADLLLPAEHGDIQNWNSTASVYRRNEPVHERIAALAASAPALLAVCDGSISLSYADLDRRANQLAWYLMQVGAGPGCFVAVCMSRSPLEMVAMLAVMKSGAAYVPLDPEYPAFRIDMIVEDVAPLCALVNGRLAEKMPASITCLSMDDLPAAVTFGTGASPQVTVTDTDVAYAIFTSGSTGRPKGVVVEHGSLLNLIDWYLEYYEVLPQDRISHVAGQGFDASVFEVWPALAGGASVHLPHEEARLSPVALKSWLLQQRITVAFVPTLLGEALTEMDWPIDPPLRVLNTAGEALRRYPSRCLPFAYYNVYGPTECTVVTSVYAMPRVAGVVGLPPIGRPISNTRIHLLDDAMQPVVPGSPGEICIAGAGVARGYLRRPDLTSERFVEDPFEPGHLYRSGDLGRWLPDGNLQFLGRRDNQVKLRGYRIEIGEVETVLLGHAEVAEVLVCMRKWAGEDRLAAYVVPQSGVPPTATELRAYMEQRLPTFMVPSAFVVVEYMPMTTHGKRDASALPDPTSALRDVPWEAPRTRNEQILEGHWIAILQVPRVGRQDDFFALGGHSLLAMQLVSRLRQHNGLKLKVRTVFEKRSLAAIAEQISQITSAQQYTIAKADRSKPIPLSSSQRGLWFLDQMEGQGARAYLVPAAFRIRGNLDTQAIRDSLDEIVRRHESLRTVFPMVHGAPLQCVLDPAPIPFELVMLEGLTLRTSELEALRKVRAEADTGFDLVTGPLIRASIHSIAVDDHLLFVGMHHIVSDGWSVGIFNRELEALYRARITASVSPLPPLPVQFADYAVWAEERFVTQGFERQLDYWRSQLHGLPERLELPFDTPPPSIQSYRGNSFEFVIKPTVVDRLKDLCTEREVTLFMGALAAFSVFLARISGQDDLAIGTPSANRSGQELEGLIGFFVNTLVLRMNLRERPGFSAMLERARQVALDAFEHQEVPFGKLVEELGVAISPAHNPLFQVMFILQSPADAELNLSGLEVESIRLPSSAAKFDLTLSLEERAGGLLGAFEYNTDLFELATIERMAERFGVLLENLVQNPEMSVDGIELLSVQERSQVIDHFNATAAAYPEHRCIHDLFHEQALKSPTAAALVFGEQTLSYAELDDRSDRLATYLRSVQVGLDMCVGICVERSFEMVIGILGILKAGAAYLPIKPETPADRIAYVLRDAGAALVLTQQALLSSLPVFDGMTLCLDTQALPTDPLPPSTAAHAHSRNLAYVMHTSGSTGEPKGVMIEHRSVVRLVKNADYADFNGEQVFLSLAPLAFDASTFEIWGALLNGHVLVIAPPHNHSVDELAALLTRHRITTLWLTAGLFHLMIDHRPDALGGLVQLLAGGDVLSVGHVKKFRRAHPHVRLVNGYGPTENATFTCCFQVPVNIGDCGIPIGRPISNTTVYILDHNLQPVPIGVRGTLFAGGDGVARGYLNKPELTSAMFIRDPHSEDVHARMYCTGDEARWLPNGTIEFLGRRDTQVKIRGFRIELGEVESALDAHPSVQKAVVTARGNASDDKRLVAYVVAVDASVPVSAGEFRAFLGAHLPDYMVPSSFVDMASLPLTGNGKVDREALPPPQEADRANVGTFVAPRNREEIILASAWEEALQVSSIGIDDNFFELGGHSLTAVKAVALASDALAIPIPVRLIFQHPTVRDLAAQLRSGMLLVHPATVVPLRSRGDRTPVFCFHALFATALFYASIARELAEDQPVYGLQAPGIYGEEEPQWAMEGLVKKHLTAIRGIQPRGPYRLVGYCMGGVLALETARKLREEGEDVEFLALIDSFHAPSGVAIPSTDPDTMLKEFILDVVARAGGDPTPTLTQIWEGPQSGRIFHALEWARKAGVLPSDITDPDAFVPWMRTSAANGTLYLKHVAEPYFGDVLFLRAAERSADPLDSWAGILVGTLQVLEAPGNHSSMLEPPHLGVIAEMLDRLLRAV